MLQRIVELRFGEGYVNRVFGFRNGIPKGDLIEGTIIIFDSSIHQDAVCRLAHDALRIGYLHNHGIHLARSTTDGMVKVGIFINNIISAGREFAL